MIQKWIQYAHKNLLCFSTGIDVAEKTGKGIAVELSIKEIKD